MDKTTNPYQWQGQPLGAADWTDIVGAANASYVPSPPWSSSPAKFRCKVAVREQMVVSTAAELIVDTNCLRPTVVSAVGLVPQNTTVVRFSDPMDPIMTGDNFNYSAGANFNITPIQVIIVDPFTVVLEWWGDELNLQLGQTYTLRVVLAVAASDPQCSCNFIIGAQVDFMTERGPEIEVLQHPNDAVVLLGNIATFSANARGSSNGMVLPVKFQWQEYSKDSFTWNDITGATNASYTRLISRCASTPLLFRCRFQVDYTFALSGQAALTVVADCSTLHVVSSVGDVRQNAVFLQFSESLDPTTALDPFNYSFVSSPDPVPPDIESVYMTNSFTVVVVLSSSTPLRNGSTYGLSISGVGDLSDPACGCKFIDPGTVVTVPAILECMKITQQPASLVVIEGCAATFEIAVRWLDGPARLMQYQWLRNGAIIPGATNRSYTTSPVGLPDQGATFSAVVESPCQVVTSKVAVLSVVLDTFAPILSVEENARNPLLDFPRPRPRPSFSSSILSTPPLKRPEVESVNERDHAETISCTTRSADSSAPWIHV